MSRRWSREEERLGRSLFPPVRYRPPDSREVYGLLPDWYAPTWAGLLRFALDQTTQQLAATALRRRGLICHSDPEALVNARRALEIARSMPGPRLP